MPRHQGDLLGRMTSAGQSLRDPCIPNGVRGPLALLLVLDVTEELQKRRLHHSRQTNPEMVPISRE